MKAAQGPAERPFHLSLAQIIASKPVGTGLLSNSPCGTLDGYGGWWFWRRRRHQLASYLGRIQDELA
jgi:hypothetical protein